MFIQKLCQALETAKVPYAIVGGYAVALYGVPRGTLDIDIVISWSLETLKNLEKILKGIGLVSRLPIDASSLFKFKEEYIEKRNLIAWNFYDPKHPSNQVDLIIVYDLKKGHTKLINTAFGKIRLLALNDLIKMKEESGRPQDLEDVKALKEL